MSLLEGQLSEHAAHHQHWPTTCRDLKEPLHTHCSYACVFPVEPQSPNGKNINLHKKWGFRRFLKERQKCGKPHFFAIFCTKKGRFYALLGLCLESAETPLFVQINVFAFWALRLDRKYTTLCTQGPGVP